MELSLYRAIVRSQFDATLDMLEDCIRRCPKARWKAKVVKYPFWAVVYHALACTDIYAAPKMDAWKPDRRFQPKGTDDVVGELPSHSFTQQEMLAYCAFVRRRVRAAIARETERSLRGPSGFDWVPLPRAELHPYSLRHVQHHVGQLGALLRRGGVGVKWKMGDKRAVRAR